MRMFLNYCIIKFSWSHKSPTGYCKYLKIQSKLDCSFRGIMLRIKNVLFLKLVKCWMKILECLFKEIRKYVVKFGAICPFPFSSSVCLHLGVPVWNSHSTEPFGPAATGCVCVCACTLRLILPIVQLRLQSSSSDFNRKESDYCTCQCVLMVLNPTRYTLHMHNFVLLVLHYSNYACE